MFIGSCCRVFSSGGWTVATYKLNYVSYENTTKQIQFNVSNPSSSSDTISRDTFIYDFDQSGNSSDGGKMIQSMLLTALTTGLIVRMDTLAISGSSNSWQIRQLELLNN
jgi:hypothetical protein